MQPKKNVHTSRQPEVAVGIVELPVRVEVVGLRWWLDVEERSLVLIALLPVPK